MCGSENIYMACAARAPRGAGHWHACDTRTRAGHVRTRVEDTVTHEETHVVFINGVFSILDVNTLSATFPEYKFMYVHSQPHVRSLAAALVALASIAVVVAVAVAPYVDTFFTTALAIAAVVGACAGAQHTSLAQRCVPHAAHGLVTAVRIPEEAAQLGDRARVVAERFSTPGLADGGYLLVDASPWLGAVDHACTLNVQYAGAQRHTSAQYAEIQALLASMVYRRTRRPGFVCTNGASAHHDQLHGYTPGTDDVLVDDMRA